MIGEARVLKSIMLGFGGGFSAGAFRWVMTASTPGTAAAAEVSIRVIRPRLIVASTSAA